MTEEILRDACCSYPKIWALGHGTIKNIFETDVLIEEKIDGSQFSFGVIRGELKCRSKSVMLNLLAPEKMFIKACNTAKELYEAGLLHDGWMYRCEYLNAPKHNTLAYERVPTKHLIGFDISTGYEEMLSHEEKKAEFERLGLEIVPWLYNGKLDDVTSLRELLGTISILGGQKIEGVVVKNFNQRTPLGQVALGKFVSEEFKEVHQADWKERGNDKKDFIELIIASYRTPARWAKAVQHLKEKGTLENAPRDIGALIKEVPLDVLAECGEEIKEKVFKYFWEPIQRGLTHGLPQWYKEELMKNSFNKEEEIV